MNQDSGPGAVREGTLLWEPSEELRSNSNVARFMEWLGETRDLRFETYDELLQWSVDDLEGFWQAIWDYFEIISHSPHSQCADRTAHARRVVPGRYAQLRGARAQAAG